MQRVNTQHGAGRWGIVRRGVVLVAMLGAIAALTTACGKRDCAEHRELSPEALEKQTIDRLGWAMDDIDATDAQRASIEKIAMGLMPEVHKLRAEHKPTRDAIAGELMSGKPDAKVVLTAVDESSGRLTAFAHSLADAAIEAHGVLNAEQREEILERFDKKKKKFEGSWMIDAGINRALDEADASGAQEELVLDHKDRLIERAGTVFDKHQDNRAALIAQFKTDKPDAKRIHALIDASSGELTGFARQFAGAAVEIAATLTPKQHSLIKEKMADKDCR